LSLLNRKATREAILEEAHKTRSQPFDRVAESMLDRIEAATRAAIRKEVAAHPSKGKTLK
jgi:hypothetical protein